MTIKLSRAAEKMMESIASLEEDGRCTRWIDDRVYPLLLREGLVARNIYHGVCFTPKGRAFWQLRRRA